jgi:hypothetical protein
VVSAAWSAGRGLALGGGPDPLELLRHTDRGHPGASGGGLPLQVGNAVVLADWDPAIGPRVQLAHNAAVPKRTSGPA